MKLKRNAIIEVVWWDAESEPNWQSEDNLDVVVPPVITSVGYYHGCHRDKKGKKVLWITMKHNRDGKQRQSDYTVIPYGCIQSIKRI